MKVLERLPKKTHTSYASCSRATASYTDTTQSKKQSERQLRSSAKGAHALETSEEGPSNKVKVNKKTKKKQKNKKKKNQRYL